MLQGDLTPLYSDLMSQAIAAETVDLALDKVENHLHCQSNNHGNENPPKPHWTDLHCGMPTNHCTDEHCDSQNHAQSVAQSAPPSEYQHCDPRREDIHDLRGIIATHCKNVIPNRNTNAVVSSVTYPPLKNPP